MIREKKPRRSGIREGREKPSLTTKSGKKKKKGKVVNRPLKQRVVPR